MTQEIRSIVFWAFLLNMVWEFGQCLFLFDMWDWPFWKATVWMWAAIIGDVFIVLGIWKLTRLFLPESRFSTLFSKDFFAAFGISILASVFLEWMAIILDLWGYSVWMPTILILGHEIGLSPIVQISFLPALSIYLAYHKPIPSFRT